MDYSQSPFVDIKLPPPLYTIPIVPLLVINIGLLCFDYVLYSNEKRLRFLLSPTQLRIFTGTLHVLLPMLIISDQPQSNALFTTAPWLLAVYSASFPIDDHFKFTDYFNSLMQTSFEPKHKVKEYAHFTTLQIRQAGLAKAVRGILKFVFLFVAVEPSLPPESRHIIEFPWLNLTSLGFILLFGLKHYCLLGILDIAFGLEQMALAEFTIDSMHEPYLSTSPRDFWSRRWNLFVSYFLHSQIFARKPKSSCQLKKKNDDYKPEIAKSKPSWWTSKEFSGFLSFFASGVFHEMMIMSICRRITLENLVFFILHGLMVMAEVKFRKARGWKEDPKGLYRVCAIALNIFLFAFTGRLFVGPYLRYSSVYVS